MKGNTAKTQLMYNFLYTSSRFEGNSAEMPQTPPKSQKTKHVFTAPCHVTKKMRCLDTLILQRSNNYSHRRTLTLFSFQQ